MAAYSEIQEILLSTDYVRSGSWFLPLHWDSTGNYQIILVEERKEGWFLGPVPEIIRMVLRVLITALIFPEYTFRAASGNREYDC